MTYTNNFLFDIIKCCQGYSILDPEGGRGQNGNFPFCPPQDLKWNSPLSGEMHVKCMSQEVHERWGVFTDFKVQEIKLKKIIALYFQVPKLIH